MKLEIIKETKLNGDQFFFIEKNGLYVDNTMTYVIGTEKEALEKIMPLYEKIARGIVKSREVYKSEII